MSNEDVEQVRVENEASVMVAENFDDERRKRRLNLLLKKFKVDEKNKKANQQSIFVLCPCDDRKLAGYPSKDDILLIRDVFKGLEANHLSPKWIMPKDCLENIEVRKKIFVLPLFRGAVYYHLSNLHARIYGSPAIIDCLKRFDRFPNSCRTIFSLVFRDICICFGNISAKTKVLCTQIINQLCGSISEEITENVTHFVTDKSDKSSVEYLTAMNEGIPIMPIEWICYVWITECKRKKAGDVVEDMQSCVSMPLKGCNITCSGISIEHRKALIGAIRNHGGRWVGDMRRGQCTHLLVTEAVGQKYKMARKWGWSEIKIVYFRWLNVCIKKAEHVAEDEYEVVEGVQENVDWSFLLHDSAQQFSFSISKDDEYLLPMDCELSDGRSLDDGNSLASESMDKLRSQIYEDDYRKEKNVDIIDMINQSKIRFNDLFDDQKFFLCGVDMKKIEKWRTLISSLGASIVPELDEVVTYILVGNLSLSDEIIRQLKLFPIPELILKSEWLIECARRGSVLNYASYAINISELKAIDEEYYSNKNDENQERLWNSSLSSTDDLDNVAESSLDRSKLSLIELQRNAKKDLLNNVYFMQNIKSNKSLKTGSKKLFTGFTFYVAKMDSLSRKYVHSLIKKMNGTIAKENEKNPRYIVYPTFVCHPISVIVGKREAVTIFWLHRCFDEETILNLFDHPMYHPLSAIHNPTLFNNLVIAFSSIHFFEKQAYSDLLISFGAEIQNDLVKRSVHGFKRNTHLIAGEENKRTETARAWDINVVDPTWIIESVLKNEVLPAEKFPFKNAPLNSSERTDEISTTSIGQKSQRGNSTKDSITGLMEVAKGSSSFTTQSVAACSDRNTEKEAVRVESQSFRPMFNLDEAYDYVNHLKSCSQDDDSSTANASAFGHMVQKILDEAVTKTRCSNINIQHDKHINLQRDSIQERTITQTVNKDELAIIRETVKDAKFHPQGDDVAGGSLREVKKYLETNRERLDEVTEKLRRKIDQEEAKKFATIGRKRENEEREKICDQPLNKKILTSDRFNVGIGWENDLFPGIDKQKFDQITSIKKTSEAKTLLHASNSSNLESPAAIEEVKKCIPDDDKTISLKESVSPKECSSTDEVIEVVVDDVKSKKRFLLSSTGKYDKNYLQELVARLGGECEEEYSELVTHTLCKDLVRNTKILCSIAKGAYLLRLEYLLDSSKSNKWLNEEDYEWGNVNFLAKNKIENKKIKSLAMASRYWRLRLQDGTTNARVFAGWKVVFYCSRKRFEEVKKIIECGHGSAVLRDVIDSPPVTGYTHVLFDHSEYWNAKEIELLKKAPVELHPLDYIAGHLSIIE